MQNAAFATFFSRSTIINNRRAIEVTVEVDSTNGWLGFARLYTTDRSKAQELAYKEAERRASAQGLTLQYLKAA